MATTVPDAAMGASEAAGLAAHEPIFAHRLTILTRLRFFFKIWYIKLRVGFFFRLMRLIRAAKLRKLLPTYTKYYPERPRLENRVFLPSNAPPGAKFPLLMVIHGGGFAFADPQMDDAFNRRFANEYNFVVVSLNYRKAPINPFPACVHDTAEIARAVLADMTLPVDYSKVAIGGFSAGGNLALAIAQLPGIKENVHAIVPLYPVVDFTGKYKGPFRTTKDGKPDMLKNLAPVLDWAYIPADQDLSDPLLSPICANREQLPQRIFFIGAECDFLCHEAEIMAKKLAGVEEKEDTGPGWEENGIKWKMVPDVTHGWTHVEQSGDAEVERQKGLDALYKEIAAWLKQ
ncbi:uncharacterized protein Z518_10914 [Rhinocladiella mackenziei CBS 650.93]|uniref:Alpha/beta hydrolase fold-3 domain-containing protein n=1 Tax=Rhinocladiella mackenziei CBS 650.93 TaxID=1442369 RepID=A0A0D2FD29_9EURO|nr:uncharacterized protein Z518_10914 [Rhinocladiella mackenziei CBS 650.93]KIW99986.1 hypothetical protein Z518_10914 [Rhinocladiella mackenziei CBS 650.93]